MDTALYIGTSGWHYKDWVGTFYPPEITGYQELTHHATHFNSVENNSSFYRMSSETTYKTWVKMTPRSYTFSLKLNKVITHQHRLALTDEVKTSIQYILATTQILGEQLGAIVIQLPGNFKPESKRLGAFLDYFTKEVRQYKHHFDIAIEFRGAAWLTTEVYEILKSHNVALVAAQSSVYPEARVVTADIAYIRMHGPGKLFASTYSTSELKEWATYIKSIRTEVRRVYVYFNNTMHRFAVENAKELRSLLQ